MQNYHDLQSLLALNDQSLSSTFELKSPHLMGVQVQNDMWIKNGSMVAYFGNLKFTREGFLAQGLANLFKKAISGEGAKLTKTTGTGTMFLADQGKQITIIELNNESIYVNGNDVLAFEPQIKYDITMMRRVTAMLSGGLFNIKLQGKGLIAITTHHKPFIIKVEPDKPVITDPNATVAWSETVYPELKIDASLKTFIGRGSGETIQMVFKGKGFVIVQPYEEIYI